MSLVSRLWKRLYPGLFLEWNIGVIHEPTSIFLEHGAHPEIEWFKLPQPSSLADPFAIAKEDKVFVFCEEIDPHTFKGRIVVLELNEELVPKTHVVIEKPFHLSYPYIIEHRGETYLLPETYQAREVALYKAVEFPYRWTKDRILIDDFAGIDSTVFCYNGKWWLACTYDKGPGDTLFLWHAQDLFGPWRPHNSNPVKTDISSSRPAGTPFLFEGSLYRPAQDCSTTYGGRIVINKVTILTDTDFEERPTTIIEPFKNTRYDRGIHTISSVGNTTFVDGKHVRSIKEMLESRRAARLSRPF